MTLLIDINYIEEYSHTLLTTIVAYLPRFVSAFIILFVGLWIIRLINRFTRRLMLKREMDVTLAKFMADILLWALRILLFITFISRLGVETSSFVAILGAMGLAVGLSLQGSLSNFAGGMLIIMFKPFRVGDYIEGQGVSGTVDEIQIFVTKLLTVNNQVVFVPNGALSNGSITNYTMAGTRRASISLAIPYTSDLKMAKKTVTEILENNDKILKDPKPAVIVNELTDNAIKIAVRPWATNENYWGMYAEVLESIKMKFDELGIELQPFVKEYSIKDSNSSQEPK